jgi:hypothetical protein
MNNVIWLMNFHGRFNFLFTKNGFVPQLHAVTEILRRGYFPEIIKFPAGGR